MVISARRHVVYVLRIRLIDDVLTMQLHEKKSSEFRRDCPVHTLDALLIMDNGSREYGKFLAEGFMLFVFATIRYVYIKCINKLYKLSRVHTYIRGRFN